MHVIGGPDPLGPMLAAQEQLTENRYGSMSIWHWLIVLLVVVLIFGTKKLRNIGQDLGGAVKGFKEGVKGEATPSRAAAAEEGAERADPRHDDRRRSRSRTAGEAARARGA